MITHQTCRRFDGMRTDEIGIDVTYHGEDVKGHEVDSGVVIDYVSVAFHYNKPVVYDHQFEKRYYNNANIQQGEGNYHSIYLLYTRAYLTRQPTYLQHMFRVEQV